MEDRWDELMIFDPAAYGLEGEIATDPGPSTATRNQGNCPKSTS